MDGLRNERCLGGDVHFEYIVIILGEKNQYPVKLLGVESNLDSTLVRHRHHI